MKRISRLGTGALRDEPSPPRGCARNKIRRRALLRLCPSRGIGFILLSWESQFTVESEGGGMFVGLVLCIERKKLQSGKPTREYEVTTFFSKDELKEEFISGKPTKEYWVTTIFSKLKEEFTSGKPTREYWVTTIFSKCQLVRKNKWIKKPKTGFEE